MDHTVLMVDAGGPSESGSIPPKAVRRTVEVRNSQGVQIGDGSFQINYIYHDALTWTDGVTRPPLIDRAGAVESPYRGLGAFGEQDAPFFHGRESMTKDVLNRLSLAAKHDGLAVISGVSGAGKSSLLQAGILPRIRSAGLESTPGAARWAAIVLTPTRDPLERLALWCARQLQTNAVQIRESLDADPASFALTAKQIAENTDQDSGGQGRLLLIVDQFEQLFTQCTDEILRRKFIIALSAAASGASGSEGDSAALVVLAIRADFEARCADFPELLAATQDRYLVTAMDELQLRAAIEMPAITAGSAVERSLVDHLVNEMIDKSADRAVMPASGAGTLPLLSHALDQAWRQRADLTRTLTLADYERTGGIRGAVAESADRAYGGLTPTQQTAARQVFIRLTATTDGGPTRDRVPREELLAVAGLAARGDTVAVVNAFTAARLVTQASDNVEISHDALLTAWPRLRDEWLADSMGDLRVWDRLRNAAREWQAYNRDPSYLYRGRVLHDASDAMARITATPSRYPELSTQERDFIGASERARKRITRRRNSMLV